MEISLKQEFNDSFSHPADLGKYQNIHIGSYFSWRWLSCRLLHHIVWWRPVNFYQTTWYNNPEDNHLHNYNCDSLKSQFFVVLDYLNSLNNFVLNINIFIKFSFYFWHICVLILCKLTYVGGLWINLIVFVKCDMKIFTCIYVYELSFSLMHTNPSPY
jgi:hypothetical protein